MASSSISSSTGGTTAPPNHHADYPPFGGATGLLFALVFTVGRRGSADLAITLTGAGPGDDVVDIGCGPGVAVRRTVARGASTAVGIDPAPVMLRLARLLTRERRRGKPAARFRAGAAEALPLPDGSATVAWSLATVHHWRDLDAGLGEVRRVLRPGGRFLALERAIDDPTAPGAASHGWTDGQAQLFAERCRAAGFVDVSVAGHRTGRRRQVSVLAERGAS